MATAARLRPATRSDRHWLTDKSACGKVQFLSSSSHASGLSAIIDQATTLEFFTNPQSRGRIVHWMLEETGVDYVTHWLDYGGAMKSPEYLAVNSMGKVPAIRQGAAVVTECAAIICWLAARFPDAKLMPSNGAALADYYRWLFFAAGPVEMAITVKSMEWDSTDREQTLGFGSMAAVLDALESWFSDRPCVCGEQFTAADVYLGAQLDWGILFGTIEARPAIAEYVERIRQRPAYARANALNEARLQATSEA